MDEPEISVNFSIEYRADDELDPYQMRLYVHLARVCSETDNGACNESTEALAAACQMSAGMVVKVKKVLAELGFIHVVTGKGKRADAVSLRSPHDMLAPSVSPDEQEDASVHRSISLDERNTSSMSPHERYEPSVHPMNASPSHVHEGARAVSSSLSALGSEKDLEQKDKKAAAAGAHEETLTPNAFSLWERNISVLTEAVANAIRDALQNHPAEWVEDAIRETALSGGKGWKYTDAILKRWEVEGRNTTRPQAATNGKPRASPVPVAVVPRTRDPSLKGFSAERMIDQLEAEGKNDKGWIPDDLRIDIPEGGEHAQKPAASHR